MSGETLRRATGFLGLCMRAGRVVSGQSAVVELIRGGQAAIVLVDEDASENTRKRVADACHTHGAPLYPLPRGELGHAIGKPERMVIALEPGGMADKLLSLMEGEQRL